MTCSRFVLGMEASWRVDERPVILVYVDALHPWIKSSFLVLAVPYNVQIYLHKDMTAYVLLSGSEYRVGNKGTNVNWTNSQNIGYIHSVSVLFISYHFKKAPHGYWKGH